MNKPLLQALNLYATTEEFVMKTAKFTLILLLSVGYFSFLYLKYYVPIWYRRLS